jgi:hypothetical protein
LSGPGGYRGGGFRGGLRGFRGGGGLRGSPYGGRGGYGRGGYAASGRNFSDQDLYKDYSGPDQQAGGYGGTYEGGFTGTGGYSGGYGGGAGGYEAEPSQQIMVRNVSKSRVISDPVADLAHRQLPWSTANEDLVELFETTGQVELAEILFDGTRSKGAGVVQFAQVPEAETAIGAFLSPHLSFVSEIVRVVQPSSSNTCMGDDPLMYASMTAGTHLPPQRPKVARLCRCSRMPSEWSICSFLRSDIVWVTSPYVCRSRGSLGKTKMADIRISANSLFESQP